MARLALALVAIAVIMGCGGSSPAANPGHRSAQRIAVQNAEVTALTLCSQSGKPDTVIKAMRDGNDSRDAKELQTSWDIATSNGALEGYYVGYAASAADCSDYLFGPMPIEQLHGGWLLNYIVVFSKAKEAQAAWKSGLFLPSPDELHAMGATVGASTGLGDNAVVGTTDNPWLAIWSTGSTYSVLLTSLGPASGLQLAQEVTRRM